MKLTLKLALPFLSSVALHAAVTSAVVWGSHRAPESPAPEVWLGDLSLIVAPSQPMKHQAQQRRMNRSQASIHDAEARVVTQADDLLKSDAAASERIAVDTADEVIDLSRAAAHPYFARLSRYLSEAKQGLVTYESRAEEFLIQIAVSSQGELTDVRVGGNESRLKLELTERMARIPFLPAPPDELLSSKNRISIRYRVLFRR